MSKTRPYLSIFAVILLAAIVSLVVFMRSRPQGATQATQKSCSPCAHTMVLPYKDFGPQSMSYEMIGMEWNQWKSEGHPLPDDVEVKVVVYRGIDLSQVEKEFPVLKGKSDYRYVEYSRAIQYFRENMKTVESYRQEEAEQPQSDLNGIKIWDGMLQTLKKTQGQIIENLGA